MASGAPPIGVGLARAVGSLTRNRANEVHVRIALKMGDFGHPKPFRFRAVDGR